MITETAFLDCENLPEAMAACFDRPWNFLGEVRGFAPYAMFYCKRCNRRPVSVLRTAIVDCDEMITQVYLVGHKFITDDMIEVLVYFGTCDRCHDVYWARSGPPFRRVAARVPVGA